MLAPCGANMGFEDTDAGGGSGDEVGDVLGKSEVGAECDSKYARVTVEWEVSGINSNSRVVVGLWFIRCKESD